METKSGTVSLMLMVVRAATSPYGMELLHLRFRREPQHFGNLGQSPLSVMRNGKRPSRAWPWGNFTDAT